MRGSSPRQSGEGGHIFLVSKDEFYIRLFEITVSNLGMWFKKKKKEDG